jgi:hypothetical protein
MVAGLERELRERQSGEDQDRDVAYPQEQVGLDQIERAVANECGVLVEALTERGRRDETA